MNRFDADLRQAARHKRKTVTIATSVVIALGILLGGYFLSFRSLAVIVTPIKASQTAVVNITDGAALSIGKRIYALSNQVMIRVSATKYQDADLTFSAADFGSDITVNLVPKPGALIATVTPLIPVNWYIDGDFVGQAKNLQTKLAPGDYQLMAKSDYHETTEQKISIEAAGETYVEIPIPIITGTLEARITPAGTLHIDGQPVDISQPVKLGPGPHAIKVSRDGYKTITETISVRLDQREFTRSYALQPKDILFRHSLKPQGGVLLINGKRHSLASASFSIPYREMIEVEYTKPGFTTKRQSYKIAPGEMINLALTLAAEFGDIKVSANIPATVYINGEIQGQTPFQTTLKTISAKLELRSKGYQTQSKMITPTAGKPQSHVFTLLDNRTVKLRDAKQSYQNTAGIGLTLIQPKGAIFTMGGIRSEPGQRANEFVRKIKLERPFYVAKHELSERQFRGSGTNMPLANVSWDAVALYCNKVSQHEGLTAFYNVKNGKVISFNPAADGYRFITEAEWEYLVRAHRKSNQSVFPWGNNAVVPPISGNLAGDNARAQSPSYIAGYQDGFSGVAPPMSFPPDMAGIYDLVGNLSEWTNDSYSFEPPISNGIETDPIGSYRRGPHVYKGANYKSASRTELRAAFRDGSDTPRSDLGFRLARYL